MATSRSTGPLALSPSPDTAHRPVDYVWAIARIAIGWIFLGAFLDKTSGWGFATPANRAWISGGRPDHGFLEGTGENALGGFF